MNDIERNLLKDARAVIDSGKEQFVCCAITKAYSDWGNPAEHTQIAWNLRNRVQATLARTNVFEEWLYMQTGIRPERYQPSDSWDHLGVSLENVYVSREVFRELCRMGRLAWIDRMLETGEIA
jgi:hypothetical protein